MPPLHRIRVLDFSHALAGPYCTLLLAQYGAEIHKLESPRSGDTGRGWGPPFTGPDSSFFAALNSGKQGIAIDLKTAAGRGLCLAVIDEMDVLVENFRPGTLDRLGLGYSHLAARNPRLVYCSISGYGQTGPARDQPAMDLIVQASSGLMSITGTPEGETVRTGHSVADTTAGLFAVIGILMALRAREQTGQGQHVDVSMLDSMVSTMASSFASYLGSGVPLEPMGTAFKTIVPYRTFPTADREIALAIGSEKLWHTFTETIGHPGLAADPGFASNALRVKNRARLEPFLANLFNTAPSQHWVDLLTAAGIPCSAVQPLDEVYANPQLAHREMFPILDGFPVTGPPIKFSATPGHPGDPAPRLGEHTRSALTHLLGLSSADLDRLADQGAIPA